MLGDIVSRRVETFDAYRETLTKEERKKLDRFVEGVCNTFRDDFHQFGVRMAKELIMALVENMGRPVEG